MVNATVKITRGILQRIYIISCYSCGKTFQGDNRGALELHALDRKWRNKFGLWVCPDCRDLNLTIEVNQELIRLE